MKKIIFVTDQVDFLLHLFNQDRTTSVRDRRLPVSYLTKGEQHWNYREWHFGEAEVFGDRDRREGGTGWVVKYRPRQFSGRSSSTVKKDV